MITPVPNHENIVSYIKTCKTVRITCEAEVDVKDCDPDEGMDKAISGLCYVMSVARGTRILWVYRRAFDEQNRLAGILHHSGWPGRFSSLSLFDDGAEHKDAVKRFIETAFPVFMEKNKAFELGSNLIESYLAAKAEADLLEKRAVKLAVALEILKDQDLKQPDCKVSEFIVSKSKFGKIAKDTLKPAIKAALEKRASTTIQLIRCAKKLTS